MADKIPKYIKNNIGKIKTKLGICICCNNLKESITAEDGSQWYVAVCKKSGLQCFATRSSLVSCDYFTSIKGKAMTTSLKDLLKALLVSLRGNDWAPLKKAINDELQT